MLTPDEIYEALVRVYAHQMRCEYKRKEEKQCSEEKPSESKTA